MRHGVYTADARRQVVPAGGQQVVESDNQRRGFQKTAAIARQIAGKIVLDIAQVHAEQIQVVFADFTHEFVYLPGPQHGVVALSVTN